MNPVLPQTGLTAPPSGGAKTLRARAQSRLPEFPFTVKIKASDATLPIRHYRERKGRGRARYHRFRIRYHLRGQSLVKSFSTFERARAGAEQLLIQISNGQSQAARLKDADAFSYLRAREYLQKEGLKLPVDQVVADWVDGHKLCGVFFRVAAPCYQKHHAGVTEKFFKEAREEFLEAKEAVKERGELSEWHVSSLKTRLAKLGTELDWVSLSELTPKAVREFLERQDLAHKSKTNLIEALNTMCLWARGRGYLSKEFSPFEKAQVLDAHKPKARSKIQIYRPGQLADLLSHAPEVESWFIAIGAFAGVRTAEFLRLDWEDLKFNPDGEFIDISASKAKTASRRLVPIQKNLKAWLPGDARQRSGKIWPHCQAYLYERLSAVCKQAGVPWKPNALRHSFISYRTAQAQDIQKVALEAGNSPKVIFENYRELVTPFDAKQWFNLYPVEGAQQLLALP